MAARDGAPRGATEESTAFDGSLSRGESRLRDAVAEAFPRGRWREPAGAFGLLAHRLKIRGERGSTRAWPAGCRDALFVDLETLGFVGRPLFLIGVLEPVGPAGARLCQYLARNYAEERDMIAGFLKRHGGARRWITFNGKSFDLPHLLDRCRYHRLDPPGPEGHDDLLHRARRVWKGVLPDCRLQTLESRVCGVWRSNDLAGVGVPRAYHEFVLTGEARGMIRILDHNRGDLLTLGKLYRIIEDADREAEDGS